MAEDNTQELKTAIGQLPAAGQARARELMDKAAARGPGQAEALNQLGILARSLGEIRGAVEFYRQALARRPEFAEAHFNLGIALEALDEVDGAIASYREAVRLRPGYIQALNNLGVLLDETGDRFGGETALRQALEAAPGHPLLLNSLGNCLRGMGRLAEARQAFAGALAGKADFFEAAWNLSLIELAGGDFKEGWTNYRNRHGVDRDILNVPQATMSRRHWRGEFFIEGEQGLGDELFFLRFVLRLKARGANIIYRPDAKIASICARLPFLDAIAPPDEEAPPGPTRLSVADLPFILSAHDCPAPVTLNPDPARQAEFRRRLAQAGPPPYLGLTWRGGRMRAGSLFKEAPLDDLARILAPLPATVIVMQRGPAPGEAARLGEILGRGVGDFSGCNESLEDMLALISLLDDYIGVSNTNMHLLAGTGGGARILVTNPAEYRWMAHGAISPWFPKFRLYREAAGGGWTRALETLSGDLARSLG